MARPRKMTTDMMLEIIDEFFNEEAIGDTALLKCSLIADYATRTGHSAAAYDFRRNEKVRRRIGELKNTNGIFSGIKPMVYKNLNVSEFLNSNCNIEQLKKALTELDTYWKEVFEYANGVTSKNKESARTKKLLNKKVGDLTSQVDSLTTKLRDISAEKKRLMLENRYLRSMLKTHLYPAVANEILKSEQLHIKDEQTVPKQTIERMTDSEHPKSLSESIKQDQRIISKEEAILRLMWEECDV